MEAPVAMFQGYDSVLGAGLSTAVKGHTESVGGTSFVKCDICSTTTELVDSLEVEQSLSVGFLGLASVSLKMELLKSLKLTSFSTSIVVFARHVQGREVATDVHLRDTVVVPTDDGQLHDFVGGYGDSYVSSRTMGGEYYAVYTYHSNSREEQSELTVQMEAEGLFKGIAVDASLQLKIESLNKTQTRRISFEQRLSGIADPLFPSSDGITAFALRFPNLQLTAPSMIQWTTQSYDRLPGMGRIFSTVARNCELLAGRDASVALSQLSDLQEAIRALRRMYAFYGGYAGDTRLDKVQKEAEQDASAVRSLVSAYRNNRTEPLAGPLALGSLQHGSPSLQYAVQVFEANDKRGGGTAFDDVDLSSYIPRHRRISAIQLRASYAVDCIVVTYTDDYGSHTCTHGIHDDDNGVLSRALIVRPGRSIKAISGHYGSVGMPPADVVTRLEVELDNGESIAGGDFVGAPFRWTAGDGAFLLGFKGRQGWFIDALELVYASFTPAEWCA